jgi:hypothetical protein
MPRAMPSMTEDRFWGIVEECRRSSGDVFAFNERLVAYLAGCDLPTIVAFSSAMGGKTGEYPNSSFRGTLREAGRDYSTDGSWQRYMGWLVAQGREFYDAVLEDPDVALSRLPESEDCQNHEPVIFAASAAIRRKSGGEWDLRSGLAIPARCGPGTGCRREAPRGRASRPCTSGGPCRRPRRGGMHRQGHYRAPPRVRPPPAWLLGRQTPAC